MDRYGLLIFDLDGTIIDSAEDLGAAVNFTLSQLGVPKLTLAEIRRNIGDGFPTLMKRCLGPDNQAKIDDALAIINEYYGNHLLDRTVLYPSMDRVLKHLSHLPLVIVTNKSIAFVEKIIDGLCIGHYFSLVLGIDSTPYKKPDRRLVELVRDKFPGTAGITLVIGDGVNDILLAKNSDSKSCAFLGGITERHILLEHEPDMVYEDPMELLTLLSR